MSKKFKDTASRDWLVKIDVAAVKRVRDSVSIDLLDAGAKAITMLQGDPVKLVDVLYYLCKAQADKESVTLDDFAQAMAGDALEEAADAFCEAMIDFFPTARRPSMTKALAKMKAVTTGMLDRATAEIEKIDVQKVIDKAMSQNATSGDSSTSSPESSGSTPTPSPSENSTG